MLLPLSMLLAFPMLLTKATESEEAPVQKKEEKNQGEFS
jgi:hypothetical protein